LESLTIGNSVYLAADEVINAVGNIHLGDEAMVGFNRIVNSGNHTIKGNYYRYGDKHILPIYVGAAAWISPNCTITAASDLGVWTLIAAKSSYSGPSEDFSS
jgi:acetyltransferase-like isoleucine patch superfamily enzyme